VIRDLSTMPPGERPHSGITTTRQRRRTVSVPVFSGFWTSTGSAPGFIVI